MKKVTQTKRLGTMIDCSRNGVMNVDSLKRWIDLTADMGFNVLMLYMEDTYEVKDNPYFGYARGRYSKDELKEIDIYAMSKGVEVIPCIQTLAHLNAIVNWPAYRDMVDCNDILQIGNEDVYKLIDNMFYSLNESLSTKIVHIGMDEAMMVGRGKYYDIHGDCDKTELLIEHLRRVSQIGEKYGYKLLMWSDMFFSLALGGEYYNTDFTVSEDLKSKIPDNVELVYWDYYSKDKDRYDKMLSAHDRIKENTWFAGGLWTWSGFSPLNQFTIETTEAALDGCQKHGVENIIFTMWGDDTSECSKFSTLPSLYYISERIKGNCDIENIKEKFEEKFDVSFDDFMLLDLTSEGEMVNTTKYVLYNDLFNGLTNTLLTDNLASKYEQLSKQLSHFKYHKEWGYIFNTMQSLCEVLALKVDLGIRIRQAYQNKDYDELKRIVVDCKKVAELMKIFYNNFEKQWMLEHKGHGFDVQDIRVGGMIARVRHCAKRIQQFINGEISKIEELEEPLLDYFGNGTDYVKGNRYVDSFRKMYTANILSW